MKRDWFGIERRVNAERQMWEEHGRDAHATSGRHGQDAHATRGGQRRWGRCRSGLPAAVVLASLGVTASARAEAFFADQVIDYQQGANNDSYKDPQAAVGEPNADTGFGILTPFNAAFSATDLVAIGPGGSLTVHLGRTAGANGTGLGIHAGVGISDIDWPNGNPGPAATAYTNPRVADVLVSEDGQSWVDLGARAFTGVTNFYSQGVTTPGYQTTPGTAEADWAKPFTQPLSAFDGTTWSGMLAVLNGSAGGDWPAMATPLAGINYVKFTVAPDADAPMFVDAVAGNAENLLNSSTLAISGPDAIAEGSYGTILSNRGTIDVQADVVVLGAHPASALINRGIVRKSAGTGTASFNSAVSSEGSTFDVQSGTLAIVGAFSSTANAATIKSGAGTLLIEGQQFHGIGSSFDAESGITEFATDAAGLAITAHGQVNFASAQHLAQLNIGDAGKARVGQSGIQPLQTGSLSIAGSGVLDLNDNDLVVNGGNFSTIESLVAQGYSKSVDPTKTGIVSSTGQQAGDTILAVVDNSLAHFSTFSGQTVAANAILGKYTYFGDLNLDGQVTGDDYPLIDLNLGTTPAPGEAWLKGDANGDGKVTGDDYPLIDLNLGKGVGRPLRSAAVPEPGALALGLLAMGGLCIRRRR